ncbi:transcription factor TFIIH holo complex protein [Malassezia pachydermatis]
MSRRDEEYVDGAEFDDSDELVEEQSDDSDEFDALPSLPTAARQTLAERVSAKRKAADAAADAQAKATSTAPKPKRSALQKNAAYSWEAAYQRSWDHVQEDESGNLESAVRQMLEIHKRKRSMRDSNPVQRGIIRHFVLVLDLSEDMMDRDLRPTRFDLTLQLARQFVSDYFDQNPIGQLAIVCTRNGLGERLSLMGGNTFDHSAMLANKRKLEPRGVPSIQNALEMARSCLTHLPNSNTREILFLSASLTSVDPGNIYQTVDKLVQDRIQVSVISLAAEIHVLKDLCARTGGDFNVVMNEDHYKELLLKHVPPRVITEETSTQASDTNAADLLVMGFPRRLPFHTPATLCACHGRLVTPSKASENDSLAAPAGYQCPRCLSKVCQVPTDCPTCGITIIMSTHLARSYHHLFPVQNYEPVPWSAVYDKSPAACFACAWQFPPKSDDDNTSMPSGDSTLSPSSRYACPKCQHHFCLECDAFIQEQLHSCPGCT